MKVNLDSRPALAPHVYLQADALTGEPMLVFPEEILALNEEAEAIVSRCDGRTSVSEIIEALVSEYEADPEELRLSVVQ
jgi:coenzyme PQQ biosynthesis protein PqqD